MSISNAIIRRPSRRYAPLGDNRQCGGFTLIELITVMVILAIISVIGVSYIVSSAESYNQTQLRALLINKSRQALERMTRQLRGAQPNSIIISGGGSCVQFLPVASGGFYLNPVPDADNGAPASSSISTADYRVDFGTARYATIGALSSGDIYGGGSSASLAASLGEGNTGSGLTLSAAKQWQRNSISQRFYLVDNPQAFCVVGGELHFLEGNTLDWSPDGTGTLMADGVSGSFSLRQSTVARSAIVDIDLTFAEQGESVNLIQEVHIRNVP